MNFIGGIAGFFAAGLFLLLAIQEKNIVYFIIAIFFGFISFTNFMIYTNGKKED